MFHLDAEGTFRSGELQQWAEQRGVEVLPCAAEAHAWTNWNSRTLNLDHQIHGETGVAGQGSEFLAWEAIIRACQAHNETFKDGRVQAISMGFRTTAFADWEIAQL